MAEHVSILIIDDDRIIRQILQTTLSRKGFDVYTANDGPSGIELARKQNVDVILLDWMMPDMDGLQVFKQLKQNEKTSQTPVFMLTSKESQDDINQAIAIGVDDYIVKPFSTSNVAQMIIDKLNKITDSNTNAKKSSFAGFFSKN